MNLKDILADKPEVQTVYLNEKGEWMFFPRPGYDKKLSREEVLALSDKQTGPEDPNQDFNQKLAEAEASGKVGDKALASAEDTAAFELEKSTFEAEKSEFILEKQALDAKKAEFKKLATDLAAVNKALEEAKGTSKSKDDEIKTLKAEIAGLKTAKKDAEDFTK